MEEPAATEAPYDPTTDPEYQATLEEQRRVAEETAAIEREIAREAVKAGVDAAGLIDPTPTSDLISAGMSVADGDFWGAGLSVVSAVPFFGDAVAKPIKATRMAGKVAKLAGKLKKLKHKAEQLAKKLGNLRKGKKAKPPGGGIVVANGLMGGMFRRGKQGRDWMRQKAQVHIIKPHQRQQNNYRMDSRLVPAWGLTSVWVDSGPAPP